IARRRGRVRVVAAVLELSGRVRRRLLLAHDLIPADPQDNGIGSRSPSDHPDARILRSRTYRYAGGRQKAEEGVRRPAPWAAISSVSRPPALGDRPRKCWIVCSY